MYSLIHARLLQNGRLLEGQTLAFDTHIRAIAQGEAAGEVLDARGAIVSPGLIDMHMHGLAGFDVEGGVDALRAIAKAELAHGVTGFVASIGTKEASAVRGSVAAVAQVCAEPARGASAALLGAHLEGPFIHPKAAGALDASHAALPSRETLTALMGGDAHAVRMITIAPELAGAMELIQWCASRNIVAALGHTTAEPSCMAEAAARGASQVTHLFNGMPPFHHRMPGPSCGALLEDRLTAELIADGVHLAPDTVRLALRVKGYARCVLVTDAMSAAGLSDGQYALGGVPVSVKDGVARTAKGNLAGSTLTLDKALRNVARWGIDAEQALAMASEIPARQLGRHDIGRLAVGAAADIVLWDDGFRVQQVWRGGKPVL